MSDVLTLTRNGAIARITINRPTAGNALDLGLAVAFRDNVAAIADDPSCRVLLIDSSGPVFCGGGDVLAVSTAEDPAEYIERLARTMHDAVLALAESHLVVIAAVQGAAAGAGLALALNADIVVASSSAQFMSAYSAIGLSPDCGTSYLLPRIVGTTRASEIALAGRRLDALTALNWGLVTQVVEPEEVANTADRLAVRTASVAGGALAATKKLLTASWLPGYREHLQAEAESISRLTGTEESSALRSDFLNR